MVAPAPDAVAVISGPTKFRLVIEVPTTLPSSRILTPLMTPVSPEPSPIKLVALTIPDETTTEPNVEIPVTFRLSSCPCVVTINETL